MTLTDLQKIVEKHGIDIDYFDCGTDGLAFYSGDFHIAIQPSLSPIREKSVLAEEYGHCATGAMYPLANLSNPLRRQNISKCERIAREYGASVLVPFECLKEQLDNDIFDVAEYFDVEPTIVELAVKYYKRKGLMGVT